MRCYLKIHIRSSERVIGVCDEDCLGKKLKEGQLFYNVSDAFFKDRLVSIEEAIAILRTSANFNAVGRSIIDALIQEKLIHPSGAIEINHIPIALKILF